MKLLRLLGRAVLIWLRRDAEVHAAALAYFIPFALTPLLLLSITLVGVLIGKDDVIELLMSWGNSLDPGITTLLSTSVQNFNILTTSYYIPLLGIIFFSTMVLIALNSLGAGLHKIWRVEASGWQSWFLRSFRSVTFVMFLQVYLVCIILLNRTIVFISHVPIVDVLRFLYPALIFGSTLLLFTIGYGLLPLQAPSLRARFYGAIVASQFTGGTTRTGMFVFFIMEQYNFTFEPVGHFKRSPVIRILLGNNFFRMREIIPGDLHPCK